MTEHEQIQAIHTASNACARYEHEPSGADRWQTPTELAASGVGDCEDFAIDALWRLRVAGLPGMARLAYCKRADGAAHMVCLFYPLEAADPWVLDVAVDAVCRLSERPDLVVVLELGVDGMFVYGRKAAQVEQVVEWAGVLRRLGLC